MYRIEEKKIYERITFGAEGIIYRLENNEVMKIFINPGVKFKTNKIEELSKIKLPGFIFPNRIVLDRGVKTGYTMDFVDKAKTFGEVLPDLSIEKKINYLKKIEKLLKQAHEHNIFLTDISAQNFLITETDEVIAIDSDNFTYKNLSSELISAYPSFYHRNYKKEFSKESDKIIFTLFLIEMLIDPRIYKILKYDLKFLEGYLRTLKVNPVVHELINDNFDIVKKKSYFNDVIDLML